MTIHWKTVEQYLTVVLFNPLPPRVKPWVIQSFLTFHSMDRRTLKLYFTLVFVYKFYPVCNFGTFNNNFEVDIARKERVKLVLH